MPPPSHSPTHAASTEPGAPVPRALAVAPRRRWVACRWALTAALILSAVAWLTTLPPLLLGGAPTTPPIPSTQPLITEVTSEPSSWDTLIFQVTATDAGIQQRRGYLTWVQGAGRPVTLPLTVYADRRPHQYRAPVGVMPGWHGQIRAVRLAFPAGIAETLLVSNVQVVTRPPWALDHLLLRAIAPVAPVFPPWPQVALLTAVLVGGGIALTLPWATWRRRLAVAGLVAGVATGLATVVQLGMALVLIAPMYAGLDDTAVQGLVPSYNEPSAVNSALVTAAQHLSDAPVLIRDVNDGSYLVYRARYLFYPRRVDVVDLQAPPDQIQQRLARDYGGMIERADATLVPVATTLAAPWRRLTDDAAPLRIWSRTDHPPAAAPPRPSDTGMLLRLGLGLGLLILCGWALGAAFGLRGRLAVVVAWPLGTTLLAWWMFMLEALGQRWTWWNVGVPLAVGAGALLGMWHGVGSWRLGVGGWRLRTTIGAYAHRVSGPRIAVGCVLALLWLSVAVLAVLLPVTDQDSWTMWAFKGQAFYRDGAMQPVLTLYADHEPFHPGYPPAQPLLQTWGYLAGGIDERLVRIVFPLWYAACLALVWFVGRQWQRRWVVAGWTVLLATTPIMLDHAILSQADLPFTVVLTLGGALLVQWVAQGALRTLFVATLALAGAAWIKLDGLYLAPCFLIAAVAVRAIAMRYQPSHPRRMWRDALLAGGALLLSLAPWRAYAWSLGLLDDTPGTNVLRREGLDGLWRGVSVIIEEVVLSHNNSTWGILGGGYGLFWLICGGALIVGWRRLRHDPQLWLLLLLVIGGVAFYAGVYALRPFFSVERYLLHLAPLAVLAALRASQPTPDGAAATGRHAPSAADLDPRPIPASTRASLPPGASTRRAGAMREAAMMGNMSTPMVGEKQAAHAAVAVIVPIYNERAGARPTVQAILNAFTRAKLAAEVVVVDDGCTDGSVDTISDLPITIVRHPMRCGYGAALKTGIRRTRAPLIAILDGDMTYPAACLPGMAYAMAQYDMLVGDRRRSSAHEPPLRRLVKWSLRMFAGSLVAHPIPDLNSGLRVLRREALEPLLPILPDGFSFTTTCTLAMILRRQRVGYLPITYAPRRGRSKLHPVWDTLGTLRLILGVVARFRLHIGRGRLARLGLRLVGGRGAPAQ